MFLQADGEPHTSFSDFVSNTELDIIDMLLDVVDIQGKQLKDRSPHISLLVLNVFEKIDSQVSHAQIWVLSDRPDRVLRDNRVMVVPQHAHDLCIGIVRIEHMRGRFVEADHNQTKLNQVVVCPLDIERQG